MITGSVGQLGWPNPCALRLLPLSLAAATAWLAPLPPGTMTPVSGPWTAKIFDPHRAKGIKDDQSKFTGDKDGLTKVTSTTCRKVIEHDVICGGRGTALRSYMNPPSSCRTLQNHVFRYKGTCVSGKPLAWKLCDQLWHPTSGAQRFSLLRESWDPYFRHTENVIYRVLWKSRLGKQEDQNALHCSLHLLRHSVAESLTRWWYLRSTSHTPSARSGSLWEFAVQGDPLKNSDHEGATMFIPF